MMGENMGTYEIFFYALGKVLIFLAPVFMIIGSLFVIYNSAEKRRSPFLTLLFIVIFVGIPAFLSFLFANVLANYHGQVEWVQEKQFFFRIFTDKLTETGNLKTAAEFMQSESVKEQTLQCIRQIVLSFRPKTIFYLSAGGMVLLLSAVSLWIKRIAEKKYYPFILVFFVLVGGILFDTGVYYCEYAERSDGVLKIFLRLQQTSVMKDLAEMKTDRSIPEIIGIVRKEAGKSGFGYGQRILDDLRGKEVRTKGNSRLKSR